MDISEAVEKIKDVGLNVYTPKNKDSGFVKIYVEPITKVLPNLSGNSVKVLLALGTKLEWNEVEVFLTRLELEKLTGLNKDAVRVALDELEKAMIIKRLGPTIRRSYMVSNYYVRLGKNQ